MIGVLFLLTIAFIFYLVIPGLGAFYIRSRWRVFRNSVMEASLYSTLTYEDIRRSRGFIGQYRMIGKYQGVEENDRVIWLKNGVLSVKVDISAADFYILPSSAGIEYEGRVERNDLLSSTGTLTKISWKNVYSIDEGSEFLVAGPVFIEKHNGVFQATDNNRLLILQFDGDAKSIMRRSIWAGRQRNEYWNVFTPGSLLLGAFSLFIVAYLIYSGTGDLDLVSVAVSLSLLPLTPLLPPGVIFFYMYRSLWERGRSLRAERDLFLLPIRFISDPAAVGESTIYLPDGELYGIRRISLLSGFDRTEGKLRLSRYIKQDETGNIDYYGFGRVEKSDSSILLPLEDPLVENVILPGNPVDLSIVCGQKARRMELFSGGAFLMGFLLNMFLVFQGVAVLLK